MAKRNPLAVSASFRAFVLDQLDELGDVVPKAMFGAVGLYRGGVFFGIVAGDVLYLKVDDDTRAGYVAAGSQPFDPYPGRTGKMEYYAVPLAILESPTDLAQWARRAVAVGGRQGLLKTNKKTKVTRQKRVVGRTSRPSTRGRSLTAGRGTEARRKRGKR